jgi:hypothetical protein
MPLDRTVRGYCPEPHSLNEPKSLYQSPSGACGSDLTHSCNRERSASVISRSWTRSSRCCQIPRGRLENLIFGNRVFPEDRADEILAGFFFAGGFSLFHESPVCRLQVVSRVQLSAEASLGKAYQRAAHREAPFLGDAPDFGCQWSRDCHALPHRLCGAARRHFRSGRHIFSLCLSPPHWCTVGQFTCSCRCSVAELLSWKIHKAK